jgi:uncharacterized protein YycO
MSKRVLLPLFILLTILGSCIILVANAEKQPNAADKAIKKEQVIFKAGDIIFQSSVSPQCEAIKQATQSVYTHCGIIFQWKDSWMVFEAVQPVKRTKIEDFIARGKDQHYVVKRLKDSENLLSKEVVFAMQGIANSQIGKNYDATFQWNDSEIYCSELVWKVYQKGASIEVGKLQKLREFDLSSPLVRQTLQERYGKNIPLDETVISPASIFECQELYTVFSN